MALVSVLLIAGSGAPAASSNSQTTASSSSGSSADRVVVPERPEGPSGRWRLTFGDEFDGTSLDEDKWDSGFGWGPASRNTFGYCDPDNSVVGGGILLQRIERRAQGGPENAADGGRKPWSVGCLNSRRHFSQLYGHWEARIWAAGCDGARAAFWGKPADESWPPELDVVEIHGDDRFTARLTQHWSAPGGRTHERDRRLVPGPDLAAGYHTFGAQWTPAGTAWFIDGVERFRTTAGAGPMAAGGPFYAILNAQVYLDTSTCGANGRSDYQYVDWVRVWTPTEPDPEPGDGPDGPPAPPPPSSPPSSPGPELICRPPAGVPAVLPSMPSGLGEVSGMAASERYPNVAWLIRDSGKPASLYAFRRTRTGPRIREIPVAGATNIDWEEIVYEPGVDGPGRLWIIESGQSGRGRWLYEVEEPDPDHATRARVVGKYRYAIPDRRAANIEAAFFFGGRLSLVVKESPARLYRLPARLWRGWVNRAGFVGPLDGADTVSMVKVSPDRRVMVAANHKTLFLYDAGDPVRSPAGFVNRRPAQVRSLPGDLNVESGDWFPLPGEPCRVVLLAENRTRLAVRLTG